MYEVYPSTFYCVHYLGTQLKENSSVLYTMLGTICVFREVSIFIQQNLWQIKPWASLDRLLKSLASMYYIHFLTGGGLSGDQV